MKSELVSEAESVSEFETKSHIKSANHENMKIEKLSKDISKIKQMLKKLATMQG